MPRIDARSLKQDVRQHNRQMAVEWFHEGYTRKQIAALLGVHEITIRKWIIKYQNGGLEALDLKKRGRPVGEKRRLSSAQESVLRTHISQKTRTNCS